MGRNGGMKISLDCLPCFVRQALAAARTVSADAGGSGKFRLAGHNRGMSQFEKIETIREALW